MECLLTAKPYHNFHYMEVLQMLSQILFLMLFLWQIFITMQVEYGPS